MLRVPKPYSREGGFTLIELLVVILIIGILAAVAIPAFMNQRQRANEAALQTDVKNVALAVQTYMMDSKRAKSIATRTPPAVQAGWNLIIKSDHPDGRFVGAGASDTAYPEGMDPIPVSEGTSIGMIARTQFVGYTGEYCILGNMVNSKYSGKAPYTAEYAGQWSKTLYYDSRLGGLYDSNDLPPGGSCKNYYGRIQNEKANFSGE